MRASYEQGGRVLMTWDVQSSPEVPVLEGRARPQKASQIQKVAGSPYLTKSEYKMAPDLMKRP